MRFFFQRLNKRTFLLLWERPVLVHKASREGFSAIEEDIQPAIDNRKAENYFFTDRNKVPQVAVSELHRRFGFSIPLEYPLSSMDKPLTEWRMETDDSPILRYLYRHFRPQRHLEFGTWQGAGVVCCLEECDATVWTINVPEGQRQTDGLWTYANCIYDFLPEWAKNIPSWVQEKLYGGVSYQTDAIGMIGRYYLEEKLGKRVCQIYCDSRDWEISNYPEGFFDSVLIDGGHAEDIVISDTRKALALVRSGGLIMWHDFCPVEQVYADYESTRGVYDALMGHFDWLACQLRDVFWVNPSWILVGIKK